MNGDSLPRASELQFIDQERIWQAPLIAAVDVSGGGAAWNVIRFRRGSDARSVPPSRIPRGSRHGGEFRLSIAGSSSGQSAGNAPLAQGIYDADKRSPRSANSWQEAVGGLDETVVGLDTGGAN